MSKLPDLEGLAVFAKVVETRSFSGAAADLGLSKATVSKIIARVEYRLGTRLFNRTSRRLALTEAGRLLAAPAARILADGETAENDTLAQSTTPRGLLRLAVPMSFGLRRIAPLLPQFLAAYPEITLDLHLSDAMVDVIGDGFDVAVRICGTMPDSALIARRLGDVSMVVVAAPDYLNRQGRPRQPQDLADHICFTYAYAASPEIWHFEDAAGAAVMVRLQGRYRVNNGDALLPALLDGGGIAALPRFIVDDALAAGRLEEVLSAWSRSLGGLYLVMPAGGPRTARVQVLIDFLSARLAAGSGA